VLWDADVYLSPQSLDSPAMEEGAVAEVKHEMAAVVMAAKKALECAPDADKPEA